MPEGLSDRDLERYDRQIRIFGEESQKELKSSSVAVVGLGGLGCPASLFLAAAGVGDLLLVDCERIEWSNLNRQVLHWEEEVGQKKKTRSAKEKLKKFNSDISVEVFNGALVEETLDVLEDVDVIVDALDNFETRYLLNEYAVEEKIPFIHAAVEGTYGQMTTIIPGETPCLRCIFPEPPEKKETFPIVGTTSGLFGVMLANEVIKVITRHGKPSKGELFIFDMSVNDVDKIEIEKDSECPVCSDID